MDGLENRGRGAKAWESEEGGGGVGGGEGWRGAAATNESYPLFFSLLFRWYCRAL